MWWRLLGVFLIAFFFAETIFTFLAAPLAEVMLEHGIDDGRQRLIFTALTEVFFTYVKVAFFTAGFICFPVFLVQFWMFVAPGLYKNEKEALAPFLAATPVLFLVGGSLVYYIIFPLAARFFISFEMPGGEGVLPIELEPKVGEYLSLMMKLIFAFGICFQLPVIMTLLARVGLATSEGMAAKRKYAIVAVFHRRRDLHAAGSHQPAEPRHSHRAALRGLHHHGAHGGEGSVPRKKRPSEANEDPAGRERPGAKTRCPRRP